VNHPEDDGTPRQIGAQSDLSAVLQSMSAFESIRQKMEPDLTNFFGCALKSFADTVLK
jgi:hypothetical protein